MFGIGLPEMILILALALIVVGPDKLPDLARSLARTILDLKKTAESLKTSFREEGNPLEEIRPELEDAARSLKNNLLEQPVSAWEQGTPFPGVNPPPPDAPQPADDTTDNNGAENPEPVEDAQEHAPESSPAAEHTVSVKEVTATEGKNNGGK